MLRKPSQREPSTRASRLPASGVEIASTPPGRSTRRHSASRAAGPSLGLRDSDSVFGGDDDLGLGDDDDDFDVPSFLK